jgi:hypothetical protein
LAARRAALELTIASTSSDYVLLGLTDLFPSALASNSFTETITVATIAACFLVAACFFKRSFCFLRRSGELNRGDYDLPG